MSAIVCYIPVLHEGYRQLFERHPDADELFLLGNELISEYEHLVKDIRKLDPELIKRSLEAWKRFKKITLLNKNNVHLLKSIEKDLVVSDDDVTFLVASKILSSDLQNNLDTIFLRWDKKKSIKAQQVSPDTIISTNDFDSRMIEIALEEGKKSKDWWRRIGAVALKNNEIIFQKHNVYVPSDQIAYDEGDPRGNFKAGEHFESSLALHAEAAIVAEAAKRGIALEGAEIYCDTFPCPPCAKQLAYSGIKTVYYRNGYSVLDGERILKSQGVKIVYVK